METTNEMKQDAMKGKSDEELESVAGGHDSNDVADIVLGGLPIDLADPRCIHCQSPLRITLVGLTNVYKCRNCKRLYSRDHDGNWNELKK